MDSGGRVDAGPGDSGLPWDGGTVVCPQAPLDVLCGVDTLTAGSARDIEVLIGGEGRCYCGETIECVARRGSAPNTLLIDAGLCAEGPLCDACFPYITGSCTLPPLEAGSWHVEINGEPAFDVDVLERGIVPEWGAMCVRPAQVGEPSCGVSWPPVAGRHDQVCHPQAVYIDSRVEIEVTNTCGTCETGGPCFVEIFDDVIRVRPSTLYPACDIACPAVCIERTDVCVTPPLPEGTWRVEVEGIGGGSTIVSTGDPGFAPGPICFASTSGGGGGTGEP